MLKKENGLSLRISERDIIANRPEPIVSEVEVLPYKHRMQVQMAIDTLLDGNYVLIVDFYSSGLKVLNALKEYVYSKYQDSSFQGQRNFRSVFRELSHRILLVVNHHRLNVRKSPEIGWFKILYSELDEFLLPFPQVQGLNSSWQWYQKGIEIPVLNEKIYPWYGTYFPTRFEHLKLFDQWLNNYKGFKDSAIDIGVGSGVLSLLLLKHGFKKITGTDSNTNAIIGFFQAINEKNESSRIELLCGDLFAGFSLRTELIVFNPPWLPASYETDGIDNAIYYDKDLFPRFFAEANKHIVKDGSIVLLFSNLGEITEQQAEHPIKAELSKGGRFQKETMLQMKVGAASAQTKRKQHWRADEMIELWVLKLKKT
ncbi:MAG: methyltransferase [Bacteroidales bacterium]